MTTNRVLTRRECLRRLLAVTAGSAAAATLRAQSPAPFPWAPLIDHIQINSDDVRASTAFYQKVLGLDLLRVGPANDPACCPDDSAFFGVGSRLIIAIRKRAGRNIDHYALLRNGLTEAAFTEQLKQRGGAPAKHDLPGFYVQDPDGILVQMWDSPALPGRTLRHRRPEASRLSTGHPSSIMFR